MSISVEENGLPKFSVRKGGSPDSVNEKKLQQRVACSYNFDRLQVMGVR